MSERIDLIGFDADDTLWDTEKLYRGIETRFTHMMTTYDVVSVDPLMHEIEIANLQYYGYGIKGFIMSLIETGVALTGGRISGRDVQTMIEWAKEMQTAPVRLLAGVQEVVAHLAASYPLMLITKGDLLDQEVKLTRSGLSQHFRYVEIVSEKTHASYATILQRYQINPERFLMVGNSLKSDILPVVALGSRGVHVPAHLIWEHESVAPPDGERPYAEIERLAELPELITRLLAGPDHERSEESNQ